MTDRVVKTATPIPSADALVHRFAAGRKCPEAWRIGVEHEKIGVRPDTGDAVSYRDIVDLFGALAENEGWDKIVEADRLIALARPPERITLEPGGQLELSGEPVFTLAEVERELKNHLAEIRRRSAPLGMAWLGIGFRPFGKVDDVPWIPKGRYDVMRVALARTGAHAHDMMKRTATVQANLDYGDEADAAEKLRASMGVTSIITALFASSPLADDGDTGYQSYRARAWLDTDPVRCGLLPFAFADGEGLFRAYTEWALDVPLLFLYRDGRYFEAPGFTFRRFLREGYQGEAATIEDWDTHLTTLFPEVRLKHYLEVRGADAGSVPMMLSLPALYKGFLYDADARRATVALTAGWSYADRLTVREVVPRAGLRAPLPSGGTVGDAARELVAIARAGLQ
ncbi:MAG TPA: glutamate-cysteine ligase family protein, partial [Haliangiales bacterium]|nr:glutamate-cysteine ligase family protein [Haliangiales bacterium]